MSKKISVAVMGYGTIGSGVVEVLEKNSESISLRVGADVECKYILDIRDFPGDPNESKLVKDVDIIANDPEVSIVVETMGGVEPAYTFVKKMLLAGKSVTTSNKALVAEKGAELIHLAEEREINFQFEASVGGGIPIIRSLNKCLTADVIEEISGILNGTTNYMLTKMRDEGVNYEAVLKEAQSLGYAEKDPTADVEGHDACRKIAILTSLISGKQCDFRKIHTEGITTITPADIAYAKQLQRRIKLIASSVLREDGTFDILVAPFLLPVGHPLYTVDGVFNAVFLHGNMLGDAMFYGSGAGKLPTASAVVADVIDMAKHPHRNIPVHWEEEELVIPDHLEKRYRYYVRTRNNKDEIISAFNNVDFLESFLRITLPQTEDYLLKKNVPDIEELNDILAKAEANSELYLILALMIRCGLSAGEICMLKFEDFVSDSTGHVGIEYCYRGVKRYIKLPDDVLEQIRRFIGDAEVSNSAYLFHNKRGNQLRIRDLERLYLKYLPADEEPHFTLSDIRNGSAAYMLVCGAPASEVANYIGIAPEWMRRFDKVIPELHKAAVDYSNIRIKVVD